MISGAGSSWQTAGLGLRLLGVLRVLPCRIAGPSRADRLSRPGPRACQARLLACVRPIPAGVKDAEVAATPIMTDAGGPSRELSAGRSNRCSAAEMEGSAATTMDA